MKYLFLIVSASLFIFPSCSDEPTEPEKMSFSTPAFNSGDVVPKKFTCDSSDVSPKLEWSNVPEGTQSFAIIIDDPDAVQVVGYTWNHCVMFNIKASTTSLKEGILAGDISNLEGLMIRNSSNGFYYQGPCPPPGQNHTYNFILYAVDVPKLEGMNATSLRADLDLALEGHVLEEARFTGTYSR